MFKIQDTHIGGHILRRSKEDTFQSPLSSKLKVAEVHSCKSKTLKAERNTFNQQSLTETTHKHNVTRETERAIPGPLSQG